MNKITTKKIGKKERSTERKSAPIFNYKNIVVFETISCPQYLSFNLKQIFHSRVIAPVFAADVAVAVDQNYQKKQLVALMILISE